ncbi:TusE/DsrC/DsvC family sulfur relay protein [Glaciecola sp. 1036]|uniref:TusE/DsrC/DsvC family sulfur relay protein n=1 Tax=Alteromonadaceae TaxID=72275 RepID=UPI003D07CAE8
MTVLIVGDEKLALDKNGYLENQALWHQGVAEAFAKLEGIQLTEQHWEVIHFVRDFYQEYDTSPAIRILVKSLKEKFGPDVGNSRYLQRLFPDGPAKMASKLAGLPKPAKCL